MWFTLLWLALLPVSAIAQTQTTVLQLATPSLFARPGETVTLDMRWNAVPLAEDYEAFVHFVNQDGVQQTTFSGDHAPPVGTSVWNGAVAYRHTVTIPASATPGTYTLRAGLYQRHEPWGRIALRPGPGVVQDCEQRYAIGTLTLTAPVPQTGGGPLGQDASQYVLTFSDEFDGSGLNTGKWKDHIWYQSSNPTKNYAVKDGVLKIWPQRDAEGKFFDRTIDTDGKFAQTYGYFEMQAKLPVGRGVWPAFWLLGRHGDQRPEIDIMEAYPGGGPDSGWGDANLHPVNYGMTLHKTVAGDIPYATTLRNFSPYEGGLDLSAGFHTYAVKWEPSGITFYFDGKQLGPKYQDTDRYYSRPMFVLLDLWFGSASGTPDATTPTGEGNAYEVRYVRVWQLKTQP
ncbi:MAG TPA: glycoside hydrolase family 16 protein [Myxococcus sp.]|nr:glycoside hydrolase family 16 protein [Myxococcus sp.]